MKFEAVDVDPKSAKSVSSVCGELRIIELAETILEHRGELEMISE